MEQAEYERSYRLEAWHWWFVSRRRLATALIEHWVKPTSQDRILDVGCGTGANLEALQQWGQVTGLDIHSLPLNFARGRGLTKLTQASALTLPYAKNSFKLVTAFDVLYHHWISDDDQAMRELYRVTQPGGWLLITDSALPLLWSSHDDIFQARCRYKLGDICNKLRQAGFEPQLCSYANFVLLPLFGSIRLMMRWFPLAGDFDLRPLPIWLNKLLINLREVEVHWLRRKRTLPIGSSLVCLCQKPRTTGII